jgi:hypothetical protein
MKYLLPLAVALAMTSGANAGYTAGELLKECKADSKKAACATYVTATWDTFEALAWTHKELVIANICIPHGITVVPAEMIKLAETRIQEQKATPDMSAAAVLLAGLRSKFNCFDRR